MELIVLLACHLSILDTQFQLSCALLLQEAFEQ